MLKAMPTGTFVSVEEYLSTDYSPDCDYVDGGVLDRNVGENPHSFLQTALASYLFSRRSVWKIHVAVEQRVQVSATRFLVPDICVVAGPRPAERVFTAPPLVCVEILSPDDRASRLNQKIHDYLAFGVRYVWVVDPETRQAFVHTAGGSFEVQDGVLRTENPEIVVPLAEIWEA